MKSRLMRVLLRVAPLLLVLVVAGCGEIDWFPEYVRQSTTPDAFSFEAKSGTEKNVSVTSGEIEVKGLTADSSPISISGASGSKYSINGAAATSSAGTVKNGDKVTVSHTSSTSLGTATTSTLTIGDVSADFVSTTKFVQLGAFSAPVQSGIYNMTFADVSEAVTTSVSVGIKDSLDSVNAQYQVTDVTVVNPDPTLFTNQTQSFTLTGKRIYVRNLAANASAVTTLTIQGANTVVTLTTP